MPHDITVGGLKIGDAVRVTAHAGLKGGRTGKIVGTGCIHTTSFPDCWRVRFPLGDESLFYASELEKANAQ